MKYINLPEIVLIQNKVEILSNFIVCLFKKEKKETIISPNLAWYINFVETQEPY